MFPSGRRGFVIDTPSGGGVWGTITGLLSDQVDLQAALDAKLDAPLLWGALGGTLSDQLDLQAALDAKLDAPLLWGDVGGTLSDQTDLQAALDLKLEVGSGYWAPITTGGPSAPELVFDGLGDVVVAWVATP
jgi:hypothetical protein